MHRHPLRFLSARCGLRLLALLASLLCLPAWSAEDSLLVAAGAGYRKPVTELLQAFERHTGIRVDPFFGNMGQALAQAGQNDHMALVFGDKAFLSRASGVRFSRWLPAGQGRLVLGWPTGKRLTSLADLDDAAFRRIALPDAQHAVYGKAASSALAHGGLRQRLGDRVLSVGTVPQVVAYLVSGEVDAGFINLTEALALQGRIGGYLPVDPGLYEHIEIVAGVVQGREGLPGVEALAAFLAGDEARAILNRHGL
jgi:molybdate transport system substrate-binding protein